jgi:hypothetical protein
MISLIHPSRGRAQKSWHTTRRWIERAGVETELIVSIDDNDPSREQYLRQYANADLFRTKIISNDNDCVVHAANHAAKEAKGDILVYVSDDFDCPDKWGVTVQQLTHGREKWLLKVDDGYQPFWKDVLTIPIMDKALYNELGYFFHPEYRSMFCDQDLFYTCKNMNVIINAQNVLFEHNHYCNKKAMIDDTYRRSDQNWNSGKELYAKRKHQNFPR